MIKITSVLALTLVALSIPSSAADSKNPNNDLHFKGSTAEVYKTIDDDVLKIHIFQPSEKSAAPRPAIVFFFGGGWRAGSPKQFEQQCRYLASRGMVAMTADYRVSRKHGTTAKECVQDGKSAIRWVRKNAKRLHIDPNRVAAGGGSAGGHVAACTGVIEGYEELGDDLQISSLPNSMVLFNPAVTLAIFNGQQPLPKDKLAEDGGLEKRMGTDPVNLSPGHHARSGLPPSIMFFGTEDFLLQGSKYFHQQMRKAGNRCDLKLYAGYPHGFFNFGRNKNKPFAQTLTATDEFLQSINYLEGNASVEQWMKNY